jgi:hypothetical protein
MICEGFFSWFMRGLMFLFLKSANLSILLICPNILNVGAGCFDHIKE